MVNCPACYKPIEDGKKRCPCGLCFECGMFHILRDAHQWPRCSVCGTTHPVKAPHVCVICKERHAKRKVANAFRLACPKICLACRNRKRKCTICARCAYCGCVCSRCVECHVQRRQLCRACGKCSKCDRCKSRHKRLTPQTQQSIVAIKNGAILNSRLINPLARAIGLELEFSVWNSLQRWNEVPHETVRDGSVKPSGLEMNVVPLSGDALVQAAYKIGLACAQYKVEVNESCGFHVHVDALDLGWWDIRKLLLIWLGIEEEMFTLVTPERKRNEFCRQVGPLVSSTFLAALRDPKIPIKIIKDVWIRSFYDAAREDYNTYKIGKTNKYTGPRYHAMNIHSWIHRGTVEFRLHEGTVDGVEIRNWSLLCGWIVETASVATFQQALNISKGGMKALLELRKSSMFGSEPIILEGRGDFVRKYVVNKLHL